MNKMLVGTLEVKLYAPWVHSLKEKRMVVRSLMGKLRSHFNAAVNEVGEQDIHQTIVIGIAIIASHMAGIDEVLDQIITFIEDNTQAELLDIVRVVH